VGLAAFFLFVPLINGMLAFMVCRHFRSPQGSAALPADYFVRQLELYRHPATIMSSCPEANWPSTLTMRYGHNLPLYILWDPNVLVSDAILSA
jgi:hypothetical protein